mmetsp:Transcript_88198/g.251849  ORF Transcript_88198/g.251849 Transcript_88198/m.251849 type:complete len:245 (-) Transcript_88198:800-1534(-)
MQADFTREIEDDAFNRHKEVGKMMDCQTLAEAFEKVGFKIDDHVSRRDLVQIYQAIEQDTKAEVKRLTDQRQYDEAKVLNERCKFMRKEFEQHLMKTEIRVQEQEHRLMRHAQKAVVHNMSRFHEEHEAETEEKCAWRTNDLKLTHENQVYNLNLEVSQPTVLEDALPKWGPEAERPRRGSGWSEKQGRGKASPSYNMYISHFDTERTPNTHTYAPTSSSLPLPSRPCARPRALCRLGIFADHT